MNKKVVLINPGIKEEKICIDYPIGLAYICAALIDNNINTEIFDLYYKENENDLLEKIFIDKPILIGFTCTTPIFLDIVNLSGKIKRILPNTKIVLGGHHVTGIAKEILEQYKQIDYIIKFEGEDAICQLVKVLFDDEIDKLCEIQGLVYRANKTIIINDSYDKLDLNKYSVPAWNKIITPNYLFETKLLQKKQASIVTMRGCWAKCSFCSSNCMSKINYKNIESISEELDYLKNTFNINSLYILDLDFLHNKKRAFKIAELLRNKNIDNYQIITRSDSLLKCQDMINYLCETGCKFIEIGIESGSQSQLNRFNKKISVETNNKALHLLNELKMNYKIQYSISFIMFDPFVTMDEIKENYRFFQKNNINSSFNEKWLFSFMDILPGTQMREMALNELLIGNNKCDNLSLFYNFKNNDVAIFYSYIYAFNKYIIPKIEYIRNELISITEIKEHSSKAKLHLTYITMQNISFKFFGDMLITNSECEYEKLYQKYFHKVECLKDTVKTII